MIALLFVVSTGVFLLLVGAICTWAVNEAETVEVLACAWLFYTSAGATISFTIVLSQLIDCLETDGSADAFTPKMYLVHGFLAIFIVMTICNKVTIA